MGLTLSGENGIVYNNLNADIKNLLMPKNWIINGMFDVWQRGTTQTTSGYGSDDRWFNAEGGSVKTHSQQSFAVGQITVPNNPKYFSRTVVTSGNGVSHFVVKFQKIEDVTKLAGKTIAISFWAKADSNKNLSLEFVQDFGSGGSALVTTIGVHKFALTTSWQRFAKTVTIPSVSGKTVGTNHSLYQYFWFDAGSDFNARTDSLRNQSGTFDIANISLVEGSVAVECQNQPYADVLRECQRYYQRFGGSSLYQAFGLGYATGATNARVLINHKTTMRSNPVVEFGTPLFLHQGDNAYAITNITIEHADKDNTMISCLVASGLTNYRPYMLMANNSLASHISFNCEL